MAACAKACFYNGLPRSVGDPMQPIFTINTEWMSSSRVFSIYTALRASLRVLANQIAPCQNPTQIWLAEILVVDVWRRREMGSVPKDWPFYLPSETPKVFLDLFHRGDTEVLVRQLLETVNVHFNAEWSKFSMITFDGTRRWDQCQKSGLYKCLSRVQKVFFQLYSSSRYWGLSEAALGDLENQLNADWPQTFDVNVWRRRGMGPVPNHRPFQMPFGHTKSSSHSFFIVDILKFNWGCSCWLLEIEKIQSASILVSNFFRRRSLGLVSEVLPCPALFEDTKVPLASSLVPEILALFWGQS